MNEKQTYSDTIMISQHQLVTSNSLRDLVTFLDKLKKLEITIESNLSWTEDALESAMQCHGCWAFIFYKRWRYMIDSKPLFEQWIIT